jgi:hypothetical protein
VLACALAVLGSLVAAGSASAAPRHDKGLTIAAVPNPILAGEGVLIYGQLAGPGNGSQPIRLYHHLDGSGRGFTLVATATTDASGTYEFPRPEGLIYTNRDWFVRGPEGAHSRTIHERVAALVTVNASTQTTDTGRIVLFRGHVTPGHTFQRVFLQRQEGNAWRTLTSGLIGPGSNYVVVRRFRFPGEYDLRVLLRGDARNVRSASDTVNVVIQQAQVPGFTVNTSAPIVDDGSAATISGVLDRPGTNQPEPGAIVQLWARHPDHPFEVVADASTGSDGSYSFGETGLMTNTVYYVATMRLPHTPRRQTARLFEGVKDTLTMQADSTSVPTGQRVTFTGTVLPDKADRVIYLQKLGRDGEFHTVAIGIVRGDSTFQFTWRMGSPDTYTFRARIPSDEHNIGSSSAPVSVTATPPALSTLPMAS